ncbi:MAG: site-2 protease family protein [Verrucomicrobiota bacterium]
MAGRQQMFSDLWHRVAPECVRLNSSAEVVKQQFRGEPWYVVRDSLNTEYFRMSQAAYHFVARLRGDRTVEEVWKDVVALFPDEAPGQDEVVQVLSQLHRHNLLHSKLSPDSQQLFQRQSKTAKKKLRGQALNFLFINIPLFNPNAFLDAVRPLLRLVFNPLGFLVWLGLVIAGAFIAVGNFEALADRSMAALAPSNLIYLYLCMVVIKALHELGHATLCKHFGGEVNRAGIMLMMLAPLPYVDATASWGFRKRWQRVAVAAAGMGMEFLLAAVALIVWVSTNEELVSQLAYNVILICTVSTVLFNANPLMKFDGYYIFSDLLDLPNLYQRAQRHIKHLGERYLLGVKKSHSPSEEAAEKFWLTLYGLASFIYRIVLLSFIVYQISKSYLGVGVALAWFFAVVYFLLPLWKLVKYLATSHQLDRVRFRAVAVSILLLGSLLVGLAFVPFPRSFQAAGVFEPNQWQAVTARSSGEVEKVSFVTADQVEAGEVMLVLKNESLEKELDRERAVIDQLRTQMEGARQDQQSSKLGALKIEAIARQLKLEELLKRKEDLEIKAPATGWWAHPTFDRLAGSWVPRGTELGQVVGDKGFSFLAVVPQKFATNLFGDGVASVEVVAAGQMGDKILVTEREVIPGGQTTLPSASLGWAGGGAIKLAKDDSTGVVAAEEFYLVRCELPKDLGPVEVYKAMTGVARFKLEPEPLIRQWERALRRVFEGRTAG